LKIIADENMAFVREVFSEIGDVRLVAGRSIDPDQIASADLLLVRSVTRVNAELLDQARNLKFVGSATIGIEHLDVPYLKSRGIAYANAPGCNALAVAEYVLSSLLHLSGTHNFDLSQQTVAIIGAGNTGTALADKLAALGVSVQLCDPPLERAGDPRGFVPFKQALKADIVSLHVPLTRTGPDATWHLLDQAVLAEFRADQYLINTSRGAVIDNQALLAIKTSGLGPALVLDVWETEPDFEQALLPHVSLATPHIAGYTQEGRARGTLMLYQWVCQMLHTTARIDLQKLLPPARLSRVDVEPYAPGQLWQLLVPLVYEVKKDDRVFRRHAIKPGGFDRLRKKYWARREFSSLSVSNASPEAVAQLSALGFSCS
jgi:erythronate-4-phosphate dehydrogenase